MFHLGEKKEDFGVEKATKRERTIHIPIEDKGTLPLYYFTCFLMPKRKPPVVELLSLGSATTLLAGPLPPHFPDLFGIHIDAKPDAQTPVLSCLRSQPVDSGGGGAS